MKTLDELADIASRNVDANLGSVCDPDASLALIGEEIFTLAYDACIDAGATETQASIVAGYMKTQY
jgi:hypothetical protein